MKENRSYNHELIHVISYDGGAYGENIQPSESSSVFRPGTIIESGQI